LPARGGEKRRRRGQTAGEPAERGRKTGRRGSLTAAYRRWPGSWSEGGGLARAEVGDSNGRFNLTRGGLGGGCPRGGGGAPRRGSPPVLDGGASGSWLREGAARLTQFLAGPTEKEREEEERTHRRGERRRRFANCARGRGGEGWPRLVRGRRGSGRAFYRRARDGGAVELGGRR
jgi:hypothetical protein